MAVHPNPSPAWAADRRGQQVRVRELSRANGTTTSLARPGFRTVRPQARHGCASLAELQGGGGNGLEIDDQIGGLVPERRRLAPAALGGDPPVAGEDPGRPFPGRSLLALSSPVEGQGPRVRN